MPVPHTSYIVKEISKIELSLEFSIKGKARIGRQLKVVNLLKEYLLIPDGNGWLSSIRTIIKWQHLKSILQDESLVKSRLMLL